MDDLANPAEPINGSQKLPAIAIIEDQVLARTCIVNILKRKITGFEIVEMATASHLNLLSGRDVRLIAFNIGDKQITDPRSRIGSRFSKNPVQTRPLPLLSNRDDEATTSAAMQRGVRGFFCELDRGRGRSRRIAVCSCPGGVYRSRSSDKMKRRSLERCRSIAVLPSCPWSTRVAARRTSCPSGPWPTSRRASNMCSRH
jgi:hypothetical protein